MASWENMDVFPDWIENVEGLTRTALEHALCLDEEISWTFAHVGYLEEPCSDCNLFGASAIGR